MRIVDLFCGCGGMSLGFGLAGYEVVAGMDWWDEALDVYRVNFNHDVVKMDLKDYRSASEFIARYKPEMIIGGPPCQDFSSAGKRNEDNGRGDLTVSYAKIIRSVLPEWFVMENVARIEKTQKLADAKSLFYEGGYGLSQVVLDASFCGVPQTRKRFFLIGKLGASDGFLLPYLEKNLSDKPLSVAEYFGSKIDFEYYYRHPRSYARRGIFSVNEPSPTIRGVNRPMPKGYPLHPGDVVDSLDGIRALTTKERSMIQTFPESFVFLGNKTNQEQMIGNAVPVNLAKFIGNAINDFLSDRRNLVEVKSVRPMRPYSYNFDSKQLTLFEGSGGYANSNNKR
ncbi:MAG: DNA cytosine methyltransferase [Muribaculum sp.]|nr:DNA cytosine methyltransferase [Muribaculum sp.]